MWLFISRRLRAWLLFSVAVPLVASAIHSLAERAHASNPQGKPARTLRRADALVARLSRRRNQVNGRRA